MTFQRLINSAVFWSWVNNAVRAVSGLILTLLLWRKLAPAEFGLSGILIGWSALGVAFDFGFAPTVDRFIGYAMGGAKRLIAHGVPEQVGEHAPNYDLIWDLLLTTRRLYRYLALILLVVMGTAGTLELERLIGREHAIDAHYPIFTSRLAWGVTLISMLLDIYSNWWGVFLRGLNEVRSAAKIAAAAATTKCGLSTIMLLKGFGLLSLPIAALISSCLQRYLARRECLRLLPERPRHEVHIKENLAAMWPTSWRMGLQLLSTYLVIQVNTLLCAEVFHLTNTGSYTYSVQLITYAASMATVWTATKWPMISQHQARKDYGAILRTLRPRIWLQATTFLILGSAVVFAAPAVLHWVGKDKNLLPLPWMALLLFSMFMDLQTSFFGTLISTGNQMPFLWTGIATNLGSMTLSLVFLRFTALGEGAFVMGPIVSNAVFNYWYWPSFAARKLQATLRGLLFGVHARKGEAAH